MEFYRFLLKLDWERKIPPSFGKTSFSNKKTEFIEKKDYESLDKAEIQSKEIQSTIGKKKKKTHKKIKKIQTYIIVLYSLFWYSMWK